MVYKILGKSIEQDGKYNESSESNSDKYTAKRSERTNKRVYNGN